MKILDQSAVIMPYTPNEEAANKYGSPTRATWRLVHKGMQRSWCHLIRLGFLADQHLTPGLHLLVQVQPLMALLQPTVVDAAIQQ